MRNGLNAKYIHDATTDTYTGFFPNHPGIIVQCSDFQNLNDSLLKAFDVFLKYWSKQSEGEIHLQQLKNSK